MKTQLLTIDRLPKLLEKHYEIKDPCVVTLPNNQHLMFASIGNSVEQRWLVGRFLANNPEGPWAELPPVKFENIEGPQLCAPAVTCEAIDGKLRFHMYIQTACFSEDGVIAYASSDDGYTFIGEPTPVMTRHELETPPHPVVGVYDAGISEVSVGSEPVTCLVFSGYRRIGNGDIYMTYRKKLRPNDPWKRAKLILAQEDVPFHNHPAYHHYEWGLEGAKIVQLGTNCYILIGVCFLPKPHNFKGMRQRVFVAASASLDGPFYPLGTPFVPQKYGSPEKYGEHGHPDTLIIDNTLHVIYQERAGDGQPWHLRSASMKLDHLKVYVEQRLETVKAQEKTVTRELAESEDAPLISLIQP